MFFEETALKETSIGKVPEDWKVTKIKDISEVKRGASPRPIGDPSYFARKGRGWIRISDVTSAYKYLRQTEQSLSELGESKSVKVNQGDLIMSICATIGKPIIIDAPACIHDGFVVFRFLPEDVDTEFLFYQLLKNEEKFRSLKQTGTQGNLNTSLVGETYISLPPFKEQRAIVGVLSLIDSAIELTDQVIVKTEQLKRGLMQQLLTHGIGHTEYKNTSIGLLPEEWSVVPCSEVCREITVGIVVTPAKYYVRSGVPCLRSFNVKENEIEPRDLVYISKESNEFHKKSIIHSGEIVAVRTGKTGVASVVPQSFDGANCVDLIIMRPNGTVEANFLSWFLNSNVVKTQVRAGETGSVQKHFNIEMVKKLAIALPSIPEQKRISAILSTLNEKLKIEQKEKAQLEKIKSGIMDLLLSGNVRIKVD